MVAHSPARPKQYTDVPKSFDAWILGRQLSVPNLEQLAKDDLCHFFDSRSSKHSWQGYTELFGYIISGRGMLT